MEVGDIVKFKNPLNGKEKEARFILVESANSMGRVKIEFICDLPFKPVELVSESEIEKA